MIRDETLSGRAPFHLGSEIRKTESHRMIRQTSLALATGLFMAGITAASAAPAQPANMSGNMAPAPSDVLNLTIKQQNTAWNDLQSRSTEQKAPSRFHGSVGAIVPSPVKLKPVPTKAATDVPSLKGYDFAMIQGKLLIVNPTDNKVAMVMSDVTGT
jgi:hypothetical protein